ncbi:lipid transfer protein EARLI 1-like [Gossypium raimondii]|uniref:lipid transfer protein EARLI 1-like n=1 Tax=Gossypium raimondii TaxID=29730 RepID=UPI00063AEA56|nr:lipid transfer protein EARLI 1-like [Gossypium raimondii]
MASKRSASMTLLLALIILFFSLVSATFPSSSSSGSNLAPSPSAQGSCPIDILKLDVCANLLGVVNVTIGLPQATPCCSLLGGLIEIKAATCLCSAIRANVLGININVPLSFNLVLNRCSISVPSGFQCAN